MKTLALSFIALALPHLCWGQLMLFNTTLTGSQEVPPTPTPAFGTGVATLDTTSLFFTLDVTFGGLVAPETAAHIHIAPPGVPGPVIIPLPLGSPIDFSTTITPAQASELMSNLWYVNIHSSQFPAGEIRGQLFAAVPEPSTYGAAALLALGTIVLWRKRRRPSPAA